MKKYIISLVLISISIFSYAQQEEIKTYTLHVPNLEMKVMDYGARIQQLKFRNTDIALGFDSLDQYTLERQNFGAVVGRYIGRITGGYLKIDGNEYMLQIRHHGDCSHGGSPNFSERFWDILSHNDTTITLRYVSPDGENGFPGELTLDVTYTLTQKQDLRIDYKATTTKPTVVNIANHNFFNLTGDHASNVLEEELWLDADSFAVYDMSKRVTGKLAAVKDTPFDFRTPHLIGERIDTPNNQLNVTKGYDHCYKLNTNGDLSRLAARLVDNHTNMAIEVYTTEPALQIYTANGHKGNMIGKNGKPHNRRNAVCFETMHFPDSPNNPQWPSTILRPGETFRSTTIFHFD